jgi:hypothetical protein
VLELREFQLKFIYVPDSISRDTCVPYSKVTDHFEHPFDDLLVLRSSKRIMNPLFDIGIWKVQDQDVSFCDNTLGCRFLEIGDNAQPRYCKVCG